MANFVQLYKSTDTNAPVLTGQANSLIALLNKVLVDGYTTASVTSITRSGATATATIPSNITLATGDHVTISGANEADYNGTFQITVLSGTQFTYTVANSPATPATGTLLYNKASLGWARPFAAGTNSQSFRSADVTSNRFYLQVIDNGATAGGTLEAQAYAAEVLTADNTPNNGGGAGSGQFPTTAQLSQGVCWRKSSTTDATARPWAIFGDDRTFYLQIATTSLYTSGVFMYGFGHFITFKAADGFNTFISGLATFNNSTPNNSLASANVSNSTAAIPGLYIARSHTQTGTSLNAGVSANGGTVMGGNGPITYPNAADNGFYVSPAFFTEPGIYRGRMPGVYSPLHGANISNYDQVTGVAGLSGITLTGLAAGVSGTTGIMAFDTFGPWV